MDEDELKIEYIKINDLAPYPNNPRKNAKAVRDTAKSIQQFGFRVPVVVDDKNIIVCGHTRTEAARRLKMDAVPCVRTGSMTQDQINAFRIADNAVAAESEWDPDKLFKELKKINTVDFKQFNFKFPEFPASQSEKNMIERDDKSDGDDTETDINGLNNYYGEERERTIDTYNLAEFDTGRTDGAYQIPIIEPVDFFPSRLMGFNYVLSTLSEDTGIHFFIDDYQFERIWNDPHTYIDRLRPFECALTPDFSLYMNMPMAMKIWNVYRSRMIGQMMQSVGIITIPTLSWAEPETYKFCFDGIAPGGTVAVSTVGVMRSNEAKEVWNDGMKEAIKRIRPIKIIVYGSDNIDFDFGDIEVKYYKARKFGEV